MFCLKNSANFQKFPGSLILEISGNFLDVKMKQNARKFWKIPEIFCLQDSGNFQAP